MSAACLNIVSYQSPLGLLWLGSLSVPDETERLCMCDWAIEPHHRRVVKKLVQAFGITEVHHAATPLLVRAQAEFSEYFAHQRQEFTLPYVSHGSELQELVWRAIDGIAYGTTISYGVLAKQIGRPTSFRAVANACGANPMSVIRPCHRVISSAGTLSGYGGGADNKRRLLEMEGREQRLF